MICRVVYSQDPTTWVSHINFPKYTPYWPMHSSSSSPNLCFRSWWPWSTCTARISSTAISNLRTFCSPQTQISHRSLFSSVVVHDIVAKGTFCKRFKTQQNWSHNEINVYNYKGSFWLVIFLRNLKLAIPKCSFGRSAYTRPLAVAKRVTSQDRVSWISLTCGCDTSSALHWSCGKGDDRVTNQSGEALWLWLRSNNRKEVISQVHCRHPRLPRPRGRSCLPLSPDLFPL